MRHQLGLLPLRPNKVGASARALVAFLAAAVVAALLDALANKLFFALAVPPGAPLEHVAHRRMVIAATDKKLVGETAFRLGISVLLVEHRVKFLHELHVDCVQKVGLLELGQIQELCMAAGYRHSEEFE